MSAISPSRVGHEVTIDHVVRGRLVRGDAVEHVSRDRRTTLRTPALLLNELAQPRIVPAPAAQIPLAEIIDFLVEVGARLDLSHNAHLQVALDNLGPLSTAPRSILETEYARIGEAFSRRVLEAQVSSSINRAALDGWVSTNGSAVRAFPPRLVHVLAGNSPIVSAMTIAWTGLLKGIGLIKMPSNDPCTAVAILRTMADVDSDHPVLRSMSAVYWRGGATEIESALLRPQYFDKLVAWGGEGALRHARQYIGPGFELVAFDPKTSVSLVGREAFASEASLRDAARLAAIDTTLLNQDACASSRYHYVEGSVAEVDRYCVALLPELGVERPLATACGDPTPAELRDEIEVLRGLEPDYRVWGDYSGAGLIVRSLEPLDSYPDRRTVNVVPVASLADAARFANVATQTVGVYPEGRRTEVRDLLAAQGAQRIVPLGGAAALEILAGLPHDGMYVLSRLARWVIDEHPAGTENGLAPDDRWS
jgi:hypothetical protein